MMPMPPLLMSSLTTSNRVITSNGHRRRSRSYENDDPYEEDDPDETPRDLKILNGLAVFADRMASFFNRISLFFTRTYLNRQKKYDGKEMNKMSKELENENKQNTKQQEPEIKVPTIENADVENKSTEPETSVPKQQETPDQSKVDADYKYTEEDLRKAGCSDIQNATENVVISDPASEFTGNAVENKEEKPEKKKTIRKVAAAVVAVIIIILLLLLRSCGGCSQTPTTPNRPDLEIEGDNKWDGTIQDQTETTITESIEIPGYSNLGVSKDNPTIRLGNPEENTVYLQYEITKDDEVIFETKAIKPGNMVEANMYELLDEGKNEVTISINTYDVETETACNGATQAVTITVY